MSSNENQEPSMMIINKEDRKVYDVIKNDKIFEKIDNKDLFFIVAGLGFHNKIKHNLKSSDGLFRASYMSPDDRAMIDAINIYDGNFEECMVNKEKIFDNVQEYACGGLPLLVDMINSSQLGSTSRELEKYLNELSKKIAGEGK